MRRLTGSILCVALCGILLARADAPPSDPALPDDPVLRAMQAELARAKASLQLEGNPLPYFIAASVSDVDETHVEAAGGALIGSTSRHDRLLQVNVRVGDHDVDNSRVRRESAEWFFRQLPEVPEEDDEPAIRRALWQAIDQAYKNACEDLATRRALLAGQAQSGPAELPDFSTEPRTTSIVAVPELGSRRAEWEAVARRLSGVFREFPALDASYVSIRAARRIVRYLDTDGTVARHPRTLWSFEGVAETQAVDGMPLHDSVSFYAPLPVQATPEESIATAVRGMAAQLVAQRSAPRLEEPFSGPLVLEDQAAAEFLLALAGRAAAVSRAPVFADPRRAGQWDADPWERKLGARVAAEILDIVDDPTLDAYRGIPLVGSYAVDDQGVPGQRVTLVDQGMLRGVLGTRQPVRGALRSNGHARSLWMHPFGIAPPAPGVLVVTAASAAPVSPGQVRSQLLETLRDRGLEHGYVIRRIQNRAADPGSRRVPQRWSRGPVADPLEVWRLDAKDGSETRIRGVRWGELDVRALKDVLVASSGDDGTGVFNLRFQSEGPALPTSAIVPRSLLFDDLELVPATDPNPTLPVLPRPGS